MSLAYWYIPYIPLKAITLWAKALYRRFGGPIAVCLEIAATDPLVYAPQRDEFIVLFPVHPATLAKYPTLSRRPIFLKADIVRMSAVRPTTFSLHSGQSARCCLTLRGQRRSVLKNIVNVQSGTQDACQLGWKFRCDQPMVNPGCRLIRASATRGAQGG